MLSTLPWFVIKQVASQLSISEKLTLRLTSKTLKEVIDNVFDLKLLIGDGDIQTENLLPTVSDLVTTIKYSHSPNTEYKDLGLFNNIFKNAVNFNFNNEADMLDLNLEYSRHTTSIFKLKNPKTINTNWVVTWFYIVSLLKLFPQLEEVGFDKVIRFDEEVQTVFLNKVFPSLIKLKLDLTEFSPKIFKMMENSLPNIKQLKLTFILISLFDLPKGQLLSLTPKLSNLNSITLLAVYDQTVCSGNIEFGLANLPKLNTIELTTDYEVFSDSEKTQQWPNIKKLTIFHNVELILNPTINMFINLNSLTISLDNELDISDLKLHLFKKLKHLRILSETIGINRILKLTKFPLLSLTYLTLTGHISCDYETISWINLSFPNLLVFSWSYFGEDGFFNLSLSDEEKFCIKFSSLLELNLRVELCLHQLKVLIKLAPMLEFVDTGELTSKATVLALRARFPNIVVV